MGPLGERYQRLVRVVELVRVEEWLPYSGGWRGRPLKDRGALARAFLAKAVLDVPTTRALVERLRTEPTLRRLCGWEGAAGVPSEATFSRAFAEFAASDLPGRLHEALLDRTLKGHLAGHVSRDSTAIPGRESPAPKPAATARPKRRRGRPRKNEPRPKEPRRLERQASMTLEEMLKDLPKVCDTGVKRNAKGYQESWTGYKLHIDAIDGGIPVSCLLTSASVRDSQAAIPLARLTASRVDSLYDLTDSAYDAPEIRAFSQKLGHVPIIDLNPRRRPQVKAERKRGVGAAPHRPGVSRGKAHPRALDRGEGERTAQGRVWRAAREGSRPGQGVVSPDVRHPGADGGAVDASDALKTWPPPRTGQQVCPS